MSQPARRRSRCTLGGALAKAPTPLGFDRATRNAIELNLAQEGGPDDRCFEAGCLHAQRRMDAAYYPEFLTSAHYVRYVRTLFRHAALDTSARAVRANVARRPGRPGGAARAVHSW